MDIPQLITLVHVAELGSISKAADRLNIVQPALSRQIRLLEEELGTPLFERHGCGMAITPAGQEVLDHAVRILAEMDAIRVAADAGRSSFKGTVRIGVTPTVAQFATVPWVLRMKKDHPDLGIRFSSAFSGYLMDWLQRGELDIVIAYDPPPSKSLKVRPVMMESLYFVSQPRGDLSLNRAIPFSRLAQEEFVLPSARHGLRLLCDECARAAGIDFHHTVEADSFGAMIDLIQAGVGSSILPLAPIHSMIAAGSLSAAPLIEPSPQRKVTLVTPADRPVSTAARYAATVFLDITTDLVERDIWGGRLIDI